MPRTREGTAWRAKDPTTGKHVGPWIIRWPLADGTYSKPVKLGPEVKSKKRAKEIAKERTEIAAREGTTRETIGRGVDAPGKTLASIAGAWEKLVAASDLAPATKADHKTRGRKIAAELGRHTAETLTVAVVRQWVRTLTGAPSTIRNTFNTLSKLLDDAMAEDWIALEANPCRHPKVRELLPAVEAPDPEDIVQMSEAAVSKLIRATTAPEQRERYRFLALTGTRDGEAAGVRWSARGEEKGIRVVRVRVSLATRGPDGWATEKAPKTRSSKRTIPLHPLLAEGLDAWKREGWRAYVGRAPKDDDPIFPNPDGKPWRPPSAELLQADLAAAELPTTFKGKNIDTRAFRRSFATWLEAHGVPGEHIDRLLGHAQASVRGRHYSAVDLDALNRAVATIRLDLGPEQGGRGGSGNRPGNRPAKGSKDAQLRSHLGDLNPRPTVYETVALPLS